MPNIVFSRINRTLWECLCRPVYGLAPGCQINPWYLVTDVAGNVRLQDGSSQGNSQPLCVAAACPFEPASVGYLVPGYVVLAARRFFELN